uniref:DRBM domain-containing protein n=1 Tax=Bombyx mori TaxID=7091 RepID=A0A8R2M020_BOMMO|nr:R2D2 protein isoform X1 [Bombyx mori]XP_037870650.1 R2D2 protein isoform X1 [Bombyx mori]XP_037870651.1 R2D2 protein isoform X1 [Bombyx mori]XP_037870652.1 R2D2 protein isoform X1 [Bombyx mori]XP_037870653.1 R2D2 protein isoform X1 [Bombyx mori]
MKTPITVLQEMMMKLGQIPEYECVAQSGPQHQATFEFRCKALGESVSASARSKREAKQEAARAMLLCLSTIGHRVPPPFATEFTQPSHSNQSAGECSEGKAPTVDSRSYVALLKELCEEYKLPGVEYALVADTGPAHMRLFSVRASIGLHSRDASGTTKRQARQKAAADLYLFLRENLSRLTHDFVEEQALVRAHERAMERLVETTPAPWKPDLGQRVSEYHYGLISHTGECTARSRRRLPVVLDQCLRRAMVDTDPEKRMAARAVLSETDDIEEAAERAAAALELQTCWETLDPLHVLKLDAAPALAFSGHSRADAARAALRYLRRALRDVSPPPPAAL